MAFLPITLAGDNLGQRQRHLNSLVRKAKESGPSFQDVETLPEESAVDRLFKIDLAIELKHVDYILRNLKDDDMLYVSRALKSTWLINHCDIINPNYLEDVLFPEMISPAVTKMKHWLYINLRDAAMCQEFYQYYKENTFEFALKFLSHCSHEFILKEAPKILTKLSPHSLKVLCEKSPKVAKFFFDSLSTDEDVKTRYLGQDRPYYNSVKCVLKSDADVFLDITEKYFNMNYFGKFSPLATNYIVRCHKTRFIKKVELYVAYLLHIPTLAVRLSVDECQEVVLKLARARYLQHWFEYKVVEPLIKRLSPDKRAAFKKRVFVDKDIGDCHDKWPYEIPAPPTIPDIGLHIFDDQDFMSFKSPIYPPQAPCAGGGMLFSACAHPCAVQPQGLNFMNRIQVKTDLDRLFDEFRFIGFERALHELGQRLGATSSTDRRRDIFLVLVSKTGGRTDAVSALLRLAAKHSNEPPHTRASILRSLVKRAKVWRLPVDVWQHLLDYGHGLGLDGTEPEAACREGLHAVVIRKLLAGECEQAIRDAFIKDFSTLVEYSLKVDERARVANGLQNMLTEATVDVETSVAAERLHQLLDVLKIYRVRVEPTSPAVKAVVALALRDVTVALPLLGWLYNEKIARRELLKFNMEFRRDEAALLNALRHDPSILESKIVADILGGWYWDTGHRSFAPQPAIPRRRVTALSTNFGSSIAQPLGFGSTAATPTGLSFGSLAAQPTSISSTAAPPAGFNLGIPAAELTEAGGTAASTTGFTFGIPAAELTDTDGSAAPPTGFTFGSPVAQPTNDSSSGSTAAPPIVSQTFSFGSSTANPTGTDSSESPNVPPRGFSFGIPATHQTDIGSSSSQPLGFGISAVQPTSTGSAGTSAAPPIVSQTFSFGSSTANPTGTDSSESPNVPPRGFSFGIPATHQTDIGSSSSQPLGFGISAVQPTSTGSAGTSAAPPIGFSFGSPAGQPPFNGRSADQPLVFGSSHDQLVVDIGSGDQPTVDGDSAEPPTVYDTSAVQSTAFISSAVQTASFSTFGAQPMRFGSSSTQPMEFSGFAPSRLPYRQYRHFRRFAARQPSFDKFTSKLGIYFDQKQDLTTPLCTALKEKIAQWQNVKLARKLACLLGNSFKEELRVLDAAGKERVKFAAALRACAHRARPVVNLAEWGWRKAGVKAVATRAMRCREIERAALTRELKAERRTVRVALALSLRSPSELFLETFISTAKLRPAVALGAALPYFHRHGDSSDLRVWDIIKPLFSSVDLEPRERLRNLIGNTDWIPATIKPDYCIALYNALYKISRYNAHAVLRDLSKLLPKCDESIENILLQMLDDDDDTDYAAMPYPSISVRYLLLSRNEEDVERRFEKIGNRFIERLDKLRSENDFHFQRRLDQILESLKYNSAFLDSKFSSCLSVIERILAWLQTFMSKEKYFKINTKVHLTMLYFKAVRQSMKQMPEVFADPKRRKSEGVEAVGFVFGRYIAKEVAELVSTYFDSIIELYTDALVDYLNCNLVYGTSRNKFIGFVLKGILTEAEGIQCRLALYVLREHQIGIEDSMKKEIEELLMKERSIEILVHAESFNQAVPIVPYFHNVHNNRKSLQLF